MFLTAVCVYFVAELLELRQQFDEGRKRVAALKVRHSWSRLGQNDSRRGACRRVWQGLCL